MALTDKVFFITGAAKGFGKGFMNAVLERGAKVFFVDINEKLGKETQDEMVAQYGSDKVKFKVVDITDHAAFEAAFKEAVATFKQIDVMVNNGGILHEGLWEAMIAVNFTAVVKGTKLAAEHMRKDKGGKGGRIINICSITALMEMYYVSIYAATKHAVRAYTASLAAQPDIEAQGLEYGILCPSVAKTDLTLKIGSSHIDYADVWVERLKKCTMPIHHVIDGFLELVQLKNMNGAILLVEASGRTYQKLQSVEVLHPDDPMAEKEDKSDLSQWFTPPE